MIPEKIKLLYLIPSLYAPGGMERILTNKINHLVGTGKYDVSIMTTDQMEKPNYFFLDKRVNTIHLNLNFNMFFNYNLIKKYLETKKLLKLYNSKLKNFIIENKIDICISLGGKELEFLSSLDVNCKKICEIHFAKDIRKQFLIARKNSLLNNFIGTLRTKQLIYQTKKLDKLIVLTKKDKQDWINTNKNVEQIYNFSFIETKSQSNFKNKKAIAIGRLDSQKGFDMLIDAWAEIKEYNKDWKLEIYGQGEWENKLKEKIAKKKVENIELKGSTNEIENKLLESSLYLCSSRYEGFPLVLLEAISCGLPIVSFDCPQGPAEIIENNISGILVEKENIEQFAEKLTDIIRNEDLRMMMGNNAKNKSQEFSKSKIMEEWENLFESLVNI
ncbi:MULTISPECIES: glycosyltransferase family 4 protein [unclassified Chryseobacterium]|nr:MULTISPECIES: glycosyltransferase family 4 protein [unclassified Chryseobacterium]